MNSELLLNWALWSEGIGWHGFHCTCLGPQCATPGREERTAWLYPGHVEERKKGQVSREAWLSMKAHEKSGAVAPTRLHRFCLASPREALGLAGGTQDTAPRLGWLKPVAIAVPAELSSCKGPAHSLPRPTHGTSHPASVPANPLCLGDKFFQ